MDDIKNYMVVLINEDGTPNYLGYLFKYNYHAQCLLDYAFKKYPNISGFKKLNYMEEPNGPIYYLSLLGNVIFTNVSVDDEKRGVIYLPKKLSEPQIETLFAFADEIVDFDVFMVYDMNLIDGMVLGKTFDVNKEVDLKEKISDFVNNEKKEKRKSING